MMNKMVQKKFFKIQVTLERQPGLFDITSQN